MKNLKNILFLTLVFCLGEPQHPWAMENEIEALPLEKEKAEKGSPHKRKRSDKYIEEPDLTPPTITSQTSTLKSPAITLRSQPSKTPFARFKEIIEGEPYPPLIPMEKITAAEEDKEGSRKWVKFLSSAEDGETHKWHQTMGKVITALRKENETKRYLPAQVNFAAVRLVFVRKGKEVIVQDIPYFFASGLPANPNKNGAKRLAADLANKKISDDLKDFNGYGLRFITKAYKGTEEESIGASFTQNLTGIVEDELKKDDPIIGKNRLQTHKKLLEAVDSKSILAMLYFHSEQSIWMFVKEMIEKFKRSYIESYCSSSSSSSSSSPCSPVTHVFVDIASYYDMCWCCGDTFASCCHTNHLGSQVYVRATGCQAYPDPPFITKPTYALRHHRSEFVGYGIGRAFEMPAPDKIDHYKPYIAHALVNDFQ
ncbi:MAG: hypothetical protein A2W46_01065 [Alphaproteobacteria bacterium RIFCSPHIGHO2_12_42_13]|nr:MAG: hypothetical protein A2W46_01065 [Alphaproteobacteria bacterium RIFCSPHIGHO2_12_42_13]